jgi:hypothetical protein
MAVRGSGVSMEEMKGFFSPPTVSKNEGALVDLEGNSASKVYFTSAEVSGLPS